MQENDKHSKTPVSILAAIIAVVLILAGREIPAVLQATDTAQGTETQTAVVEMQESEEAKATENDSKAESKAETASKTQNKSKTQNESKVEKESGTEKESTADTPQQTTYKFRSKKLLSQHYEKHGIEMGFDSAAEYEAAASAVINNPEALYKTEKEDGDGVYYVEATNEFVILSTDGYIRTYFYPSGGISYFNRQ